MPESDPQTLLRLYADAAIPRHERRALLVIAAAEVPPKLLAAELPPDLLDELRRDAAAAPATPEKVRVFRPACANSELGWDDHWRALSRQWHTGILAWRRYFGGS